MKKYFFLVLSLMVGMSIAVQPAWAANKEDKAASASAPSEAAKDGKKDETKARKPKRNAVKAQPLNNKKLLNTQ